MKITAEPPVEEPTERRGESQPASITSSIPDMLIRTISGRILSWSIGMERRYGFTSEQAVGRICHELLNSIFARPLDDIGAALLANSAWSGGVVHRHANGRAVAAMSYWGLLRADSEGETVVIEMHASAASPELADRLAIVANDLSQPLTAIGNYIGSARRILKHPRADQELAHKAMTLADIQLVRGADQVRLLRQLVSDLRQNG